MKRNTFFFLTILFSVVLSAHDFTLTPSGYFRQAGVEVMAFSDFYPEGHQGGICLIMNGQRIATNGDLRLEPTPGQWQPVPKQLSRVVSDNAITTRLCYPDSSRHLTGFNPMIYPDLQFTYSVRLEADGADMIVSVDLDEPLPADYVGRVGFNLELFPGLLFGQPWLMDGRSGIFPQQANGPVATTSSLTSRPGDFHPDGKPLADIQHFIGQGYSPIVADDIVAEPYAEGLQFTSCPNDPLKRVTIRSLTDATIRLYDGRLNHNNGWFVLRSTIPAGVTRNAIRWRISPSVTPDWQYQPVVQTSQVGYLPQQRKVAIVELDSRTTGLATATLCRLTPDGEQLVCELHPAEWGSFLRYRYATLDFSSVTEEGMYIIHYGNSQSSAFRIANDVLSRGVWQPVIEYFLPVQMCHMRVMDKYRVWHDCCHMDDARMAKPGNLFDGYNQEAALLPYPSGTHVHDLNQGGWHDAGDFDLRVESQAGECYILSLAYEQFRPEIDVTCIDQQTHTCEIHQPDSKNDILQQIEHGALSVVAGYRSLGRLYRGIICPTLRQYVMLGDAAAMTDHQSGTDDDRWVFTESNPSRELATAAQLATTSRALRGFNPDLSAECLAIAKTLYDSVPAVEQRAVQAKMHAAAELYITTRERSYLDFIVAHSETLMGAEPSFFNTQIRFFASNLSVLARVEPLVRNMRDKKVQRWCNIYRKALAMYSAQLNDIILKTPYGVPYEPSIWGAGWDIQRFGFENYFLAVNYPDLFSAEPVCNALNFVLGCHPGSNTASFASGVGAKSATVGYGLNRADWSYIPGGVISGTALIRPDFPELLTWPYLWQQTEYVLGGGSSHYLFLVLAVQSLLTH